MSQLKKKIAEILRKRIKIIGSVKLSTVLEELEIQIHGPCFKLPILTLFQVANIDNGEITIINADIVEKILKPSGN